MLKLPPAEAAMWLGENPQIPRINVPEPQFETADRKAAFWRHAELASQGPAADVSRSCSILMGEAGRGYSCPVLRQDGVTVEHSHDFCDVPSEATLPKPRDDHLLGDAKSKIARVGWRA